MGAGRSWRPAGPGRPFRARASSAAVADRAGHQRTGPWTRHGRVASVTAQTAPQFLDLFSYIMPPNESVRLAAVRSS